jgi:F0F1-type ATP synthase assembly protein I
MAEDKEKPSTVRDLAQAEKYFQLAIALPAATFIGWGIGTFLDSRLHTGWIAIAGLIMGSIAGLVMIIRMAASAGTEQK